MSPRVLATVAAAIALTAGLTACSGAVADSARSSSNGAATARARSEDAAAATVPAAARQVLCPLASLPAQHAPTELVPAGFAAVAVVDCVHVPAAGPSTGLGTEEKREVAVSGLAALLTALRLPSAPRRSPLPACLVTGAGIPQLTLIGRNGQVIHPTVPTSACGLPIEQVLASLTALHWISLGVTPGGPVIPQTAVSPLPAAGQPSIPSTGRPPLHGGPVHRLTPGG
jgi:hypothetical protein